MRSTPGARDRATTRDEADAVRASFSECPVIPFMGSEWRRRQARWIGRARRWLGQVWRRRTAFVLQRLDQLGQSAARAAGASFDELVQLAEPACPAQRIIAVIADLVLDAAEC